MEEVSHMSQATADVQYLEELRQRINASAEKMLVFGKDSRHNWFFAIIGIALIAVFYVLVFHCGLFGDDVSICAFVCFISFLLLLEMLILQHHFIAMENAGTASQHYRAARRFIKTIQWGGILGICGICILPDLIEGEELGCMIFCSTLLILYLLAGLSYNPYMFINKDFYEDVEELGEYE